MMTFVAAVSVALVVSFLCSIFEAVLLSIGHAQVEALAAAGRRSGELMRRFKRRIDTPIAAILTVNTMAHTVGASVAGASYVTVFNASTLWVFTIVFTIAVLLFTEIVPKTLGVTFATRLAGPVAYGIQALTTVLYPVVAVSERISRALRGGKQPPVTSLDEIRLLALLGRSEGLVGPRTAQIIVGATRLRQLRVHDVMVPRGMVTYLSGTNTREEVLELVRRAQFSRFAFTPTGDIDQVSGVVLTKDLLLAEAEHPFQEIDWAKLVREPLVVPSNKPLNTMLRAFQEVRSHMAIVVNEYGEFEGIVTLEDVLEELVGEIEDEADQPSELWAAQADGSLLVPATAELRKLLTVLGADWPGGADVATVGGFVTQQLGRLPVAGDVVLWGGHRFEVAAANPRRAELIVVTPAAPRRSPAGAGQ